MPTGRSFFVSVRSRRLFEKPTGRSSVDRIQSSRESEILTASEKVSLGQDLTTQLQ
ncbi:hypothetical protein DPMN_048815 [Dreissena polymorpha]|uniref:Uncharacterized protein n=1 Tax=Dreissena polymorpha TaxID=45954 RepID=A0A9D4DA94_DREPO|nr:hypothetical protein DPMN_048815 [Dreissena polymorpha]